MKASDVMSTPVVTVRPSAKVAEVARVLAEARISAVPVVDDRQHVIGIVSEGDLLRRREIGTGRRHSWWLETFAASDTLAREYTKTHATSVVDVMTRPVVSVSPATPLAEIAEVLEKRNIKRVPVLEAGRLVGIVSRADLIRALARTEGVAKSADDATIRNTLHERMEAQSWLASAYVSFTVANGCVELSGIIESAEQHKALRVLAESVPGVTSVNDRLVEMSAIPHGW